MLLAVLIFSSCAMQNKAIKHRKTSLKANENIWDLYPDFKGRDFSREIRRLKKITNKAKYKSSIAGAYLRITMLSIDYKNPSPNYYRAAQYLELYRKYDRKGSKRSEIKTLSILLDKFKKAYDDYLQALGKNKRLKKKVNRLIRENKAIKETVEELKKLDLLIEEMRKNIK